MKNIGSKLREAFQAAQLKLKFGHYYGRTLRDWGVSMDMWADMNMGSISMRAGHFAGDIWAATT